MEVYTIQRTYKFTGREPVVYDLLSRRGLPSFESKEEADEYRKAEAEKILKRSGYPKLVPFNATETNQETGAVTKLGLLEKVDTNFSECDVDDVLKIKYSFDNDGKKLVSEWEFKIKKGR